MYLPAAHRQDDRGAQLALIRANPLGLLLRQSARGLEADPIPFLIAGEADALLLQAHVARANPLWRDLDGGEVLVVFQDANAYVSPSLYPSKKESGKVVPTWNYAMVHVWGRARAIDDRAFLRAQVETLTNLHERKRDDPWRVTDAPPDYLEQMLGAIVGVAIAVTRIEGKWKMSQNRSGVDREGVVAGLRATGDARDARVAALVDEARKK